MNAIISARGGALCLTALLLCGLLAGCGGSPSLEAGAPPGRVSPAPAAAPKTAVSSVNPLPIADLSTGSSDTEPAPEGIPAPSHAAPSPPATGAGTPEAEPQPGQGASSLPQAAQPEPPASGAASTRPTALTIRTPSAPGKNKSEGGGAVIDYSNCNEGYVMVKYSGGTSRVKIQITGPDKITYTYDSGKKGFEAFPLTAGNGSYTVNVYTEIHSSQYALAQGASFKATLSSALLPYLYPSQYVNYTADSAAVAKGEELAASASTVLEVVGKVYNYVINNVTYDDYKAANVKSGYLPSPDATLSSGKGICFDYAALLATMLRSQNIPTRLEVGYVSGGIYHAWVSIYTTETGWINGIIQFDGKSWKLLDPTFASNGNQSSAIMQFIGNGSNYQRKYCY